MTDRYAVMGHPIAHSKSPFIHSRFAAQTGEDLRYEALYVEPDGFEAQVSRFFAEGGRGLNITLPFKQRAWALAGTRTPRAELAGAVNTLWVDGEVIGADNTDGVGLVRDITVNQQWPLAGARVLLLGAGGAARGVLMPLLEAGTAEVVVANRTPARAVELCRHFAAHGRTSAREFASLAGERFGIIINATAASLDDTVPPLPAGVLAAGGACYDLMYAARPTAFLRWALEAGPERTADGVGMLVEQAAEAFHRWRGVRPITVPVIAALRELLAAG